MRPLTELRAAVKSAANAGNAAALQELIRELSEHSANSDARVLAMSATAAVHDIRGELQEAIDQYHKILTSGDVDPKSRVAAKTMNSLGMGYLNKGDNSTALQIFHDTIPLLNDDNSDALLGGVVNNIGLIHFSSGNLPEAMNYYRRALQLHREANDKTFIAITLCNMQDVLRIMNDWEGASVHTEEALELFTELNIPGMIAKSTAILSYLHHVLGNYTKSNELAATALQQIESVDDSYGKAVAARIMANVWLDQERNDEALALLDQYIEDARHFPVEYTDYQTHRADILVRKGNIQEAVTLFSECLDTAIQLNDSFRIIDIHRRLRDAAKTLGDFEEYVKHNEEYQRLNEEYKGTEASRKFSIQQKEYEIEHERAERQRERDKERALLSGALPQHIAERMLRGEKVADHFDNASTLFLDIVGFTNLSSSIHATDLVNILAHIFNICDSICAKFGVTKVKTIGDSYMAFSSGER